MLDSGPAAGYAEGDAELITTPDLWKPTWQRRQTGSEWVCHPMSNREGGTGWWVQRGLLDFRHPGCSPRSANPLRGTPNWPLFTKHKELAIGCDSGHEQALAEPREGQDLSRRACPEPWQGKMVVPIRNYENRVVKAEWSRREGRRGWPTFYF